MSVPGAENPEKVKNIVRGEGVLEGFREMYGGLMGEFEGLRWAEQPGQAYRPASEKHGNGNRWSWMGEGEYELMVSGHYYLRCIPTSHILLVV